MTTLILFTTEACHLCEQAKEQIYSVIDGTTAELVEIDIADDENLMTRYGTRIPVLKNAETNTECCWPFGREQIQKLLNDRSTL